MWSTRYCDIVVAVVAIVVRGGGDRSSVGSARSVARARMLVLVLVLSCDLQCCGVPCRAVPCRPVSLESVSKHIVSQRTMRIVVKGVCVSWRGPGLGGWARVGTIVVS